MTIHSHSDRWFVFGSVLFCFLGLYILIESFFTNTPFNVFWACITALVLYGSILASTDLYLSILHSPVWIQLQHNAFTVKLLFRAPFTIDVRQIDKIEKRRQFQVWGFFTARLTCSQPPVVLYLQGQRFEGQAELFRQIKQLNPDCQIAGL